MKTRIFLFIGILLLSYSTVDSKERATVNNPSKVGSLNVFTSPDLYNLTMKWVNEYGILKPELKINVTKTENESISGFLNTNGGLGFVDNESFNLLNNQATWNMVVGRDVIVPVMNVANPLIDEISRKGLTLQALAQILGNPEKQSWGTFTGGTQNIPVNCYVQNDPSLISEVESFLNTGKQDINAIKTTDTQEMISAIQKDPNALGFCKLIQIIDVNNQTLAANIKLVPIDKNGNGKIDYMENIYENLQAFTRGVWIGKYPKALSGNIYSVSTTKPRNEAELAFLNWVLTDGQQFLNANGYSDLVSIERKSQLDKINAPAFIENEPVNSTYAMLKIILIVLFGIGLAGFILDMVVRRIRNKKEVVMDSTSHFLPVFDDNSVIIPKGLYFDKTHTWSFMKKDGTVKIGIDDFLQHITGFITRIEMKNVGDKIKKGERLLTIIQKGKQLNIYSPVTGTIKTQNETLLTNSSLVNTAPYENGWVYTIEPTNWLLEIQFLTMAEKYKTWLKDEFSRLKDFFATITNANSTEFALITLQDGGSLKDSILQDLGPEVWEDFQTKFIDNAK